MSNARNVDNVVVDLRVLDTHVLGLARSGAEVEVHLGHHADTAEGGEAVVRADAAVKAESLTELAGEAVDSVAAIIGVGSVVALSSDDVGSSQGEDGGSAHLDGLKWVVEEQRVS